MARYKMKENDFETPPENVYSLDLTGIDMKEGKRGPFLRWRWVISDIPEQAKYAGVFVTSITPPTPTVNNRFGQFLKTIYKDVQVGFEGDSEELIDSKLRVKGFVEHNKQVQDGEEVIYCNVSKLLENSAQMGVGIGRQEIGSGGGKKSDAPAQPAKTAQPAPAGTGEIPW